MSALSQLHDRVTSINECLDVLWLHGHLGKVFNESLRFHRKPIRVLLDLNPNTPILFYYLRWNICESNFHFLVLRAILYLARWQGPPLALGMFRANRPRLQMDSILQNKIIGICSW